MGNKLREIFTKTEPALKGQFTFNDAETRGRFLEAINKVWKNGETVFVGPGVSIKTYAKAGGNIIPFQDGMVKDLVICPTDEPLELDIDIDGEPHQISCSCIQIEHGFIIKAPQNSVISFQMIYNANERTLNLSVNPQLEYATCTEDVIESYKTVDAVFRKFVKIDELDISRDGKINDIQNLFKRLEQEKRLFEKAVSVEKELNIKFDIAKINQDSNYVQDLQELYFALIKKLPIRLNAKVNATETSGINFADPSIAIEVGSSLNLTYHNMITYNICGTEITLFAACMILNAIAKKIVRNDDSGIKVIFGEEEAKPMYLSYRAFTDETDAANEKEVMMDHKDDYVNAKTALEYMSMELE